MQCKRKHLNQLPRLLSDSHWLCDTSSIYLIPWGILSPSTDERQNISETNSRCVSCVDVFRMKLLFGLSRGHNSTGWSYISHAPLLVTPSRKHFANYQWAAMKNSPGAHLDWASTWHHAAPHCKSRIYLLLFTFFFCMFLIQVPRCCMVCDNNYPTFLLKLFQTLLVQFVKLDDNHSAFLPIVNLDSVVGF